MNPTDFAELVQHAWVEDEQPFPSPGLFVAGEKCQCFEDAECCPSVVDGMRWWRHGPEEKPKPCVCRRAKEATA